MPHACGGKALTLVDRPLYPKQSESWPGPSPTCSRPTLPLSSDLPRISHKGGRSGQKSWKSKFIPLGEGSSELTRLAFGDITARGEGAVFRLRQTSGRSLHPTCVRRGGVAVIKLAPFEEVRKVHAKGPLFREERARPHNCKL